MSAKIFEELQFGNRLAVAERRFVVVTIVLVLFFLKVRVKVKKPVWSIG